MDQDELQFFIEEFPDLDPDEIEELLEALMEDEMSEGKYKKSKNFSDFNDKDKDKRDPISRAKDTALSKLNSKKTKELDD